MTIDYNDHEHVRSRMRKRRRRLIAKRRNASAIKKRRSLIIGLVCVAVMMTGCYAVYGDDNTGGESSIASQSEPAIEYKSVIVRSGDTLWDIASKYSGPSKDVRNLVKEMCTLNDVNPGNIYPGQIIKVPIYNYS